MGVKVRERNGAWWVFVDYKGRRKARRVGAGKEGKRAAVAAAEQIQAKLALGDLSLLDQARTPQTVLTFRVYAERWLDSQVRLRCKPSTYEQYHVELRSHWFPPLGDVPLTALTRDRIKMVLGDLGQRLRATTIRASVIVPLQGCLSAAVEDGLLPGNPAARLGRFIRSDILPQERLDPFTRAEVNEALLPTAESEWPEWYPSVMVLARAGVRFGEMAALKPEDLDFRECAILVRRGVYKGRLSTPKNNKGRRVDMSQQLAHVLQGWLTLRTAEAVVSGRPASPWLFSGPDGDCLNRDWFSDRIWTPLLRRAGLRYRPLHQLRHTFASLLIEQRESLAYIRDQLGHHSIRLTVDTYGHLVPGSNRQAVDRLDDATFRNLPATEGPTQPAFAHSSGDFLTPVVNLTQ
jgi:integrase